MRARCNSIDEKTITDISRRIDYLIGLFSDERPVRLVLDGGEISLIDVENLILKNINSDEIESVKVVTNLSNDLNYYKAVKLRFKLAEIAIGDR